MSELSDYEIEKIVFELSQKTKCLEWSRMNNFADGMKYMRDYFKNDERHTCDVGRSEYDAASEYEVFKAGYRAGRLLGNPKYKYDEVSEESCRWCFDESKRAAKISTVDEQS